LRKKIIIFICLLILTAPLSMNSTHFQVTASSSAKLTIKPEKIIDQSLVPGSTITINASVIDVSDIYAWQVKITFNPTIINCSKIWLPSDHIFAGKSMTDVPPVLDNVNGYVMYGATLVGEIPTFSGSGTLCQLNFTVIGKGASNINFSTPYGEDTFLLNSTLDIVSVEIINGYFANAIPPIASFDYSPKTPIVNESVTFNASASYDPDGTIAKYEWAFGDSQTSTGKIVTHTYNAPGTYTVSLKVIDNDGLASIETKNITVYEYKPTKLYVNPKEISNPTLLPPSLIQLNITIEGVKDMYGYEFKLSYDTDMLTCIGAIINIIQNQTNFTPTIFINDGAGYIWINVSYRQPSTPITANEPENLVTLYLQIDKIGYSQLHLNETKIWDAYGNEISHQTEDGFIMTLIRDVSIAEINPSNTWTYQNWTVSINVVAKNLGNTSESFNVSVYYNETLIGVYPVTNLAPATQTTIIVEWDTTGIPEGIYQLKAEASLVPYEYNITNNALINGTIIVVTKIRDVSIASVNSSRNWAFPGMSVNITLIAENLGEFNESFNINVYCNETVLATYFISNLASKSETALTFPWNTSSLKPGDTYYIKGEASLIQYEYNATNNVYSDGTVEVRVTGDENGDGRVDIKDVSIIAKAFGTYPGHERWNSEADITGSTYLVPDGVVDIRDVAIVSKNFGKSIG